MLRIEPRVFLYGALLLLVLPGSWVLAAVAAAVIHELCHIAAVWLLDGTVAGVWVDVGAARIEARLPNRKRELAAALAGPAGSLMLLAVCHVAPKVAICAFLQGMYNLLPIYPLDGGRALRCLLEQVSPARVEDIFPVVENTAVILLLLLALAGGYLLSLGIWPVLAVLLPISRVIRRKIPCKRRRIRVQ